MFENVGGGVFDASLARMNAFGRVAVCGLIGYSGQDIALHNVRSILVNRLTVEGFIVSDHMDIWPNAPADSGRSSQTEAHVPGDDLGSHRERPAGFHWAARGENIGKQLVKVS